MQDPIDDHDLAWLGRLARGLLGESSAADLVQDTVAATIERPVPSGVPRRAWLATIARRLASRKRRSDRRRIERETRSARPEALGGEEELLERAEAIERVTAAARALPEPFRRTILLRFLADLEPEEIARREGRPVDTVRWRVRRGLEMLRRDLAGRSEDWRSMSLALLPLAPAKAGLGLTATGAVSKPLGSSALGILTMKSIIAVSVLIACCGYWVLGYHYGSNPELAPVSFDSLGESAGTARRGRRNESPSPSTSVFDDHVDESRAAERGADAPVPEDASRVVDAEGRGVAGAIVFTLPTDDASTASVTTGPRGYFVLEGSTPVDIGVTANGFLRAFARDFRPGTRDEIVLERGSPLIGRVVDGEGRPVAGLEILAHTPGTAIDHVSPSQMRRRARRAAFGDESKPFEGSRGRTNDAGLIELDGLPEGKVRVRSLDPTWALEGPSVHEAGGPFVEWIARPRLGVRVLVSAPDGEPEYRRVSAVFRVDLTLADGSVKPFEQWVGRGDGEASFALDATLLPPLAEDDVRTVTFHGTIKARGRKTAWRAEPLELGADAPRMAIVPVFLGPEDDENLVAETGNESEAEAAPPAREPKAPLETTTLRLDVRYLDGTPVSDRIAVRWTGRGISDGEAKPEPDTPGFFLIRVPARKLSLRINIYGASGSLDVWEGTVACTPGVIATKRVDLEQGGTAIIQRPGDFVGNWNVHASWRPVGEKKWRGSWNYGTTDTFLKLSALKPLEWRFRVSQDGSSNDYLERVVTIRDGETRVVDP